MLQDTRAGQYPPPPSTAACPWTTVCCRTPGQVGTPPPPPSTADCPWTTVCCRTPGQVSNPSPPLHCRLSLDDCVLQDTRAGQYPPPPLHCRLSLDDCVLQDTRAGRYPPPPLHCRLSLDDCVLQDTRAGQYRTTLVSAAAFRIRSTTRAGRIMRVQEVEAVHSQWQLAAGSDRLAENRCIRRPSVRPWRVINFFRHS